MYGLECAVWVGWWDGLLLCCRCGRAGLVECEKRSDQDFGCWVNRGCVYNIQSPIFTAERVLAVSESWS